MKTNEIIICVISLLLGMLFANLIQDTSGCTIVEGARNRDMPQPKKIGVSGKNKKAAEDAAAEEEVADEEEAADEEVMEVKKLKRQLKRQLNTAKEDLKICQERTNPTMICNIEDGKTAVCQPYVNPLS